MFICVYPLAKRLKAEGRAIFPQPACHGLPGLPNGLCMASVASDPDDLQKIWHPMKHMVSMAMGVPP